MCFLFSLLFFFRNPNCVRQLSADSITPSHTMPETSTPSGSHVSPLAQKTNDSTKRAHPTTHNQQQQQQQQSQPIQKQMGNLVADINALGLESNNSQPKGSQQQSRPNQTASNNQSIGNTSTGNTNGNCTQPTSANNSWQQQTSPSAANGTAKTITPDNSTSKFSQNGRRTLNSD